MCVQDEPVSGVMLVTPDFVMFDPDECTQSNTTSLHSMTAPMSAVLSVSVYHDATPRRSQSFVIWTLCSWIVQCHFPSAVCLSNST